MRSGIRIVAFADVGPGGSCQAPRGATIGLVEFRQRIAELCHSGPICALSAHLLPPRIWLRRDPQPPTVLALVGGYAGHCEFAAPLCSALGLPAHLFVPLEQIGRAGRATLAQIRESAQLPGIRLEVDLSGDCPASLWGRVELLKRAACVLAAAAAGQRPRYVWWGTQPLDVRAGLLLRQTGYAAILCRAPSSELIARGVPLLAVGPARAKAPGVVLDCATARF